MNIPQTINRPRPIFLPYLPTTPRRTHLHQRSAVGTKPRPATSWPQSAPQALDEAKRPATPEERQVLMRFPGFGPVALGIFPDPVTGHYPDASWQQLGQRAPGLLTPEDYASAKRTTFTAFYTSPLVIRAMHEALKRFGVPQDATVLEPGCGIGNFIALGP